MPRYILKKFGILPPHTYISVSGDDGDSGGGGEDAGDSGGGEDAGGDTIEGLQQQLKTLIGVNRKLRVSARRLKTAESILGDTDNETLQKYKLALEEHENLEGVAQARVKEAVDKLEEKYRPQIHTLISENEALKAKIDSQTLDHALFKAFSHREVSGIPGKFDGFAQLLKPNIVSTDSGYEIHDDSGAVIMYQGDRKIAEPATLQEFMVMVGNGQLGDYKISNLNYLEIAFEPKIPVGAGRKPVSGYTGKSRTPIQQMSQSELGEMLFS